VASGAVLAVLAGLLAVVWLRHEEATIRARLSPVAIVVAGRDLSAASPLAVADMRAAPIPRESAPGGALVADAIPALVGRRLLVPLRQGDPILASTVAEADSPRPLADDLGRGRRAVAIPIEPAAAVAGFLEPGDLVDLLLVWEGAGGSGRAATLLEAVRLLAVGDRRRPGAAPADATTAVLDVTPEEAELVHVALERGRLALVLRRPGDRAGRPERRVVTLDPWLPGYRPAGRVRALEVIHGTQ
jgi:pilus assembly protein CpaB